MHLSTTDKKGGAGIAAYRLHKGIINNGVKSQMFVQRKYGETGDVFCSKNIFRKLYDFSCFAADKTIAVISGPRGYEITSPALFASMNLKIIDELKPDIVHIHWICGGFLSPEKIAKIKKPIVWTFHDMWPFSGINHLNDSNKDYISGNFKNNNFLDKWTWERKKRSWKNLNNLTVVSPSKWLANEAKSSYLFRNFRIENIPNGIDTNVFKECDKLLSKKKYGLPLDKKLLLFGAANPLSNERKGYKLLISVIQKLLESKINKNLALVIFGSANKKMGFGLPTYFIGEVSSEKDLAEIYSAADIFITPSREDNLPNTVIESMSCGTPVVAFNIGGMPDMIDNKVNGVMVAPFKVNLMAREISLILNNKKYHKSLSIGARRKVLRKFNINLVVKKYCRLYESILNINKITK